MRRLAAPVVFLASLLGCASTSSSPDASTPEPPSAPSSRLACATLFQAASVDAMALGVHQLVIAGIAEGHASFGTVELDAADAGELYIAGVDPSTCGVTWLRHFGSWVAPSYAASNGQDELFLSGWFNDVANVGAGPVGIDGGVGRYLARYSADGGLIWSRVWTDNDTGSKFFRDLSPDSTGGLVAVSGLSEIDAFDSDGGTLWTRDAGQGAIDSDQLARASDWLARAVADGPGGDERFHVSEYGPDGGARFIFSFTGSSITPVGGLLLSGMQLDASGDVFLAGSTYGALRFDGGASLVEEGVADGFVLSLDAQGNLRWAQRIGGADHDWTTALLQGRSDELVILGDCPGPCSLAGARNTIDFPYSFVLRLDLDGGVRSVEAISDDVFFRAGAGVSDDGSLLLAGDCFSDGGSITGCVERFAAPTPQ